MSGKVDRAMLDVPEYWQAVAGGIDAEETKASLFIKHAPSIGVAREIILRELLVRHTPEPFRIATGFIYNYLEGIRIFGHLVSATCWYTIQPLPSLDMPSVIW